MANEKKKFNIYNLFNPTRDGKGVKKEPDSPRNLKYFFKLYLRYFGRLTSVNMYVIFGNFPFLFVLFGLSGNLNIDGIAPASQLFSPFYGSQLFNGNINSPVFAALYGVHGLQAQISMPTTATYVMYALGGLILFTFGLVSVGTSYILRNLVKGEPVFMWHDFWYAIKRNLRQGIIFGIIDIGLMALLVFDVMFFYINIGSFIQNMMFYFSIILLILYFVMRFYIYLMMVTFNLSIYKLIKNAFIFAVLGFKRNFMAILGIVFLVFINYSLLLMFIPLGVIFPFVILFGHGMFITAYAAYPKIDEIMIKPYYNEPKPVTEAIFIDRG